MNLLKFNRSYVGGQKTSPVNGYTVYNGGLYLIPSDYLITKIWNTVYDFSNNQEVDMTQKHIEATLKLTAEKLNDSWIYWSVQTTDFKPGTIYGTRGSEDFEQKITGLNDFYTNVLQPVENVFGFDPKI